jgi:hypothetical protein
MNVTKGYPPTKATRKKEHKAFADNPTGSDTDASTISSRPKQPLKRATRCSRIYRGLRANEYKNEEKETIYLSSDLEADIPTTPVRSKTALNRTKEGRISKAAPRKENKRVTVGCTCTRTCTCTCKAHGDDWYDV